MTPTKDFNWRQALRGEPTFGEVLADPIVKTLMARDGVSSDQLKRLADDHRAGRQG